MTKLLILTTGAALSVAAMLAQTSPQGSAFQQPGWIAAPGGSRVAYPALSQDGQFGPVTGRPFSGTEVRHTMQTLADGTHVEDSSSSLFYRDAQGRMRSESPTRALIYDPVAGVTVQLDLKNKTYSKSGIRDDAQVSIAVIGNRTSISTQGNKKDGTWDAQGKAVGAKAQQKAMISNIHAHAVS